MDIEEKKKYLDELDHRIWFCDKMIDVAKKRRHSYKLIEFFYFVANIVFLTIGIHGITIMVNANTPISILHRVAFVLSGMIGGMMLLLAHASYFLLKDLEHSIHYKKNKKQKTKNKESEV